MTGEKLPSAGGDMGREESLPEEFQRTLVMLAAAGWDGWIGGDTTVAKGDHPGYIDIVIIRAKGRLSVRPDEAVERLSLVKKDGHTPLPGYDAVIDDATSQLCLRYKGSIDSRYRQFFEGVITLGSELSALEAVQ